MYVFSSLSSLFTYPNPNVSPHLSPLQHISQKHKYIQNVQTLFESKSSKPQSSGSMAPPGTKHNNYGYAQRLSKRVEEKTGRACPHCHHHFYGGSRAAFTHMRFCVSSPNTITSTSRQKLSQKATLRAHTA